MIGKDSVTKLLELVSLKSQQSALCLAIVVVGDQQHASLKQTFVQYANDSNAKK